MITHSATLQGVQSRSGVGIPGFASASDQYTSACHFIADKYRSCYGATIQCDYKNILVAQNSNGKYLAAAGYRTPNENFYLEYYLTHSAQQTLSNHFHHPVSRNRIIEIGNLVSNNSKATFSLMQQLWNHLATLQYQYVMLTCTRQLERRFRHLPYLTVAKATSELIPETDHWGSYYDQQPVVIAGKLSHYDQRFRKFSLPSNITISLVTKPGTHQ